MTDTIVPSDVNSPLGKAVCTFLHFAGASGTNEIAAALDLPTGDVLGVLSTLSGRGVIEQYQGLYCLERDLRGGQLG